MKYLCTDHQQVTNAFIIKPSVKKFTKTKYYQKQGNPKRQTCLKSIHSTEKVENFTKSRRGKPRNPDAIKRKIKTLFSSSATKRPTKTQNR